MPRYINPPKIIRNWDELPLIMDLPMVARLLAISPETLLKRCQRKDFPAFKECNFWRVCKDDLMAYIDSKKVMDIKSRPDCGHSQRRHTK